MATISILSPNYSPVVHNRRLLSAKVHLPECFTQGRGGENVAIDETVTKQLIKLLELPNFVMVAIDTWLNSSKNVSLKSKVLHHKQMPKGIHCRVASSIHDHTDDSTPRDPKVMNKITDKEDSMIKYIRTMLSMMEDGRISVSPYDTAWIALIKDVEGREIPQFRSSLEWITQHQLPDGSWGDVHYFCPYDRIINTLACVVALRSWNAYVDKAEKGISYIKENIHKLEEAKAEHMPGGFELIIPALLQRARKLGIDDMPYDAPVVRQLHDAKNRKLNRIPLELMHEVPTTLLYSLEGLENLDWEKLLKLQSADGSFLTSPSSTAFAFMETKDENCFKFINNIVEKFNGGAPHAYPVDLFARLWAVDRLQRLGISRFFKSEIKDCLSYFSRYWTDKGVFSGRGSIVCDIDCTSMGFRLLRLHGYDVDPNALGNFKQDDKFSCFRGQMIESPSPIYNLYRASQVRFPGETILEEANNFAYNFLQESLARNEFLDKWVISKHLFDEIRIGLEMPWYASLPRVEASYYLRHYGGANDVWIGKNLYRMEEISNDTYLELARLDFNRCQEQHQFEWNYVQEWYESSNVQEFGISKKDLLLAYFLAAATIFEPERKKERILWAKSQILSRMITSFFINETTSLEHKTALLTEFRDNINLPHKTNYRLVDILLATLHQLQEGFDERISHQLRNTWGVWMMKLHQDEAYWSEDAELLVTTLNICAGHTVNKEEDILSPHEYQTLSKLTNKICRQLSQIQSIKVMEMQYGKSTTKSSINEIDHDMQTLVKLVIKESVGVDKNIKQKFLSVARTFYYSSYNAIAIIDLHIFKVLFEPVQ